MTRTRFHGRYPAVAAIATAVLLVCSVGPPLAAQSQLGAKWRGAITRADQDLQAGNWERVSKRMSRLLEQMKGSIESGPGAGWYLGSAAAMRAVAEAGLGNEREAAWDWHMAVTLHPDWQGTDLGRYGEAGLTLQRALGSFEVLGEGVPRENPRIVPPRKTRAPNPEYPRAKRLACLEEAVVVEAVIGRDGVPFQPQLQSRGYPVMGFAVMETLRGWRFEPARLDGEPVLALYQLTTTFALVRCSSDVANRGRRLGAARKTVD